MKTTMLITVYISEYINECVLKTELCMAAVKLAQYRFIKCCKSWKIFTLIPAWTILGFELVILNVCFITNCRLQEDVYIESNSWFTFVGWPHLAEMDLRSVVLWLKRVFG